MSTKRKWLDIDEIESGTGTARETGPAARRMAGGRAGGWISIDALESRGEQQGAALLRLAGEVAARQKQEAARPAGPQNKVEFLVMLCYTIKKPWKAGLPPSIYQYTIFLERMI